MRTTHYVLPLSEEQGVRKGKLITQGKMLADHSHFPSFVDPSVMNAWKEENYLYDTSYGSTVGN